MTTTNKQRRAQHLQRVKNRAAVAAAHAEAKQTEASPPTDTRNLEPQPAPYFAPGDTFTFSTPPPRRTIRRRHPALHSILALSLLGLTPPE